MAIRITTLVENSSGEHLGLIHEHGLSFLIEKDNRTYLFDTGQSDAIIKNARKLQLDLFQADKIIISHGHYDHSGGVRSLLQSGGPSFQPEFILHNDFFNPKYSLQGSRSEYLGSDFDQQTLEDHNCVMRNFNSDIEEIEPGVWVVGNFLRYHTEETINDRFRLLTDEGLILDDFRDEIMLVVSSPKGLILIMGCAHPGIMNMIDTVRERIGENIHAILGGTHLVEARDRQLDAAIEYLNNLKCDAIGVSHCTGNRVMEKLSRIDPRFFHNRTGSSLIIS